MGDIYFSCIKDKIKNKSFFIIEIEKSVMNKTKIKKTDKLILLFGKSPRRFRIVKSENGHSIKKSKSNDSYEFVFYDKDDFRIEFYRKPVSYFIKNGNINVFL